jgi:D-inositol-3-phosphate glycosyltransferase
MGIHKTKISLLTGGNDPHYVMPLASILATKGMKIDFVGNDEMKSHHLIRHHGIHYYNLRGNQDESAPLPKKIIRIIRYYLKLIMYAAKTETRIFHIIWLNKFIYFDRTILNLYYRSLKKKIVFTAHNVNEKKRDNTDNFFNRLTLKIMYHIVSHIFVHTKKMKQEIIDDFKINERKITVIPFGVNNAFPRSNLSSKEARKKLGLEEHNRVLLFFGQIAPYKGLDRLLLALPYLKKNDNNYKLIIAGKVKQNFEGYWNNIEKIIKENQLEKNIIRVINFIPDQEIEKYFKAADVLILPYINIFQTGVLFIGYSFGLPVVATDVGSLKEDIIENITGFVCKFYDPESLAKKIIYYFDSSLFKNIEANRPNIIKYVTEKHSWEIVGNKTVEVYNKIC